MHSVRKLRAAFFNACSLKAHIEEIRQYIRDNPDYDVIGVAETRFHPMLDDTTVMINGYSLVRQDRNTHGGGVALYFRNTYRFTSLATSDTTGPAKPGIIEYIMGFLDIGMIDPVFVSVVYRPPDVSLINDPGFADNLKLYCGGDYKTRILMGDFNTNLLTTSLDETYLRDVTGELALKVVEHGATNFTTMPGTWIDAVFVDGDNVVTEIENRPAPYNNSHNIISVTVDRPAPSVPGESFSYRAFKKINPVDLNALLSGCDWSSFDSPKPDLTDMISELTDNLTLAIDSLAPLRTVVPRKRQPPWIDEEIRVLHRKRDAALRRHRSTGDSGLLDEFFRLRRQITDVTKLARTDYIRDRLKRTLDEGGNFWKELRSLGLLPKSANGLHGFSLNDLNEHFAAVSRSPTESVDEATSVINSVPEEGFTFKHVSLNDVILAVAHFTSQAKGEDGIPQSVIAKALPTIGPVLVALFNYSLDNGVFPGAWRRAQLVPLKKKSAPSSSSDFRPIALLCFLSKVLEKLVHDQLIEYILEKGILDPLQTGFRQHHSTTTALLKLTDDIRSGFDKKLITFALLFDFSKAFDTISPTALMRKLSSMGLSRSALCWIHSYLLNRSQRVFNKDETSDWVTTNLGVPQGSVLGPLLFCLYINDVQQLFFGNDVRHILYADDLQIYVQVPFSRVEEGICQLSTAARAVSDWAAQSGLRLNPGKTQAICFASQYIITRIDKLGLPGVDLGSGVTVPFTDTVTSLGVVLDRTLSWKPFFDCLATKVNRVLYALRFVRSCTTESLRRHMVQALIFPLFDYYSVITLDATYQLRSRLQRLQNACVRYIFGLRRTDHVTPLRRELGWMRTDTRRQYFTAVLLYKIINFRSPSYLYDMFQKRELSRPARGATRDLNIPRMHTDFGQQSFKAQGVRLWNSLPECIKYLPSLSRFKYALREHLLNID